MLPSFGPVRGTIGLRLFPALLTAYRSLIHYLSVLEDRRGKIA